MTGHCSQFPHSQATESETKADCSSFGLQAENPGGASLIFFFFFWVTHFFGISRHSQEDREYEWLDHLPIPATRNTILGWLFLPIMRLKWSLRSFWGEERHILAGKQPQLYPRSPAPSPDSKDTHIRISIQVLEEVSEWRFFRILALFYSVDRDLSWSLSCYLTDPDKEPVLRTTSQEDKVQNLERIRHWAKHTLTM